MQRIGNTLKNLAFCKLRNQTNWAETFVLKIRRGCVKLFITWTQFERWKQTNKPLWNKHTKNFQKMFHRALSFVKEYLRYHDYQAYNLLTWSPRLKCRFSIQDLYMCGQILKNNCENVIWITNHLEKKNMLPWMSSQMG